jgi:hypothetical protein
MSPRNPPMDFLGVETRLMWRNGVKLRVFDMVVSP